jgi:hypothetical protein
MLVAGSSRSSRPLEFGTDITRNHVDRPWRRSELCSSGLAFPCGGSPVRGDLGFSPFLRICPSAWVAADIVDAPCCSALFAESRETTWIGLGGYRIRVPAAIFSLFVGGPEGLTLVFSPFSPLCRVGGLASSSRGLALDSGGGIARMRACAGGRSSESSSMAVENSFCR